MTDRLAAQFAFLNEADQLKQVMRATTLVDGSRPENSGEHSWHLALYALMLAIPLSGWLMSSAKGFQTVWFGVLPIPDLLDKNKELGDLLQTVHMSLNLFFAVVIAGHIGAALKHHFIDKDDILTRILPRHTKEN